MKITLVAASVFLISLSSQAFAKDFKASPFGEASIAIVDDDFDGKAVQFTCQVLASGSYVMHLSLPDEILLGEGELLNATESADSGDTITGAWAVSPTIDGTFMLEVSIEATIPGDEDDRFARFHSVPGYITVDAAAFSFGSTAPPPQYEIALEDTLSSIGQSGTAYTISVNITGRVLYRWPELCFTDDFFRGVPGLTVYLDWDNNNSPSLRSTPYCESPFSCTQAGRDFAITGMDGTFNFDFTFTSDVPANQITVTDAIRVWVQRGNAGGKIHDEGTSYFIPYDVIDISQATTSITENNARVQVDVNNGTVLRGLYRARQFYRLELGTPSVGPIEYKYENGGTTRTHWNSFLNEFYIIFTSIPQPEVAYHEYGHCVDIIEGGLRQDGFDGAHAFFLPTDYGTAWKEGWANFYAASTIEYWQALELDNGVEFEGIGEPSYVYTDFMDQNYVASGVQQIDASERPIVEGVVAAYLYNLHDAYRLRADGYVGDNEDVRVHPADILHAFSQAEIHAGPNWDLLPELNDQIKSLGSTPLASSVQGLYDYLVLGEEGPRSPTPTQLTATIDDQNLELNWVDNTVAANIAVGAATGCPYAFEIPMPNAPGTFRVYSRSDPPSEWNQTLSGYALVDDIDYPNVTMPIPGPVDGPVSYVVVSINEWGASRPQAELTIVPPAYFQTPDNNTTVSAVVSIEATINPLTEIEGISINSQFSSFDVEWGAGSSPTQWGDFGITYLMSRTATVENGEVATWNTGVVPAGTYTLRIVAHYGQEIFETRHVVEVTHRSTTVMTSGGDFSSIQAAINWAEVGDEILVSPGTYSGNLVLKQTIQITGTASGVEIVGSGNNATVSATNHAFPATIANVTIRHPSGSSGNSERGVRLQDASLTMRKCVIRDFESGSTDAAGIYATGDCSLVLDSVQVLNTTGGGALMLRSNANGRPTVAASGCTFRDNHENGSASGGAVRLIYTGYPLTGADTPPSFNGCSFVDNSAESGSGSDGAGLDILDSGRTITINDCVFVDNVVGDAMGAAVHLYNSRARVENCTIANNQGELSGDQVSGVLISGSGNILTLLQSIVAYNDGPSIVDSEEWWTNTLTISDCLFHGHATDETWAGEGENTFVMDPAFCDAVSGDYHLYAFSPCVVGPGYFTERIGALDVACVPQADVTATSSPVAACPAGDNVQFTSELVVTVDFQDAVMTRTVEPNEITLNVSDFVAKVFDSDNTLTAYEAASAGNLFTTFVKHKAFGACSSSDLVEVLLNGEPLLSQASVNIRTWDLAAPYGSYSLPDFGAFGVGFPVNPAVNDCRDFNNDSKVDVSDFSWFGQHYTHSSPYQPANASEGEPPTSGAAVSLVFTDEYETANRHRLLVDVSVTNFGGVMTSMFEMTTSAHRLAFVEWQPAGQSIGTVMVAPVSRESEHNVCFGVLVSEGFAGSESALGRLVFNVTGDEPFEVGDGDFVLTYGEVLGAEDGEHVVAAQMAGVLERILDSEVIRLYHDRLEQNFPNPFNPTTTIAFSIKSPGNVNVSIYDVAGRRVRELVNERRERGAYREVWDGQNDAGQIVASGVYFYKITAGSFTDTKKMTMLK